MKFIDSTLDHLPVSTGLYIDHTSVYPEGTVARLVAFATKGVDLSRTAIHVKGGRKGARGGGRAYPYVPMISRSSGRGLRYLMVCRIPHVSEFPFDNMVMSERRTKWVQLDPPLPFAERDSLRALTPAGFDPTSALDCLYRNIVTETSYAGLGTVKGHQNLLITAYRFVGQSTRHPYGGKRSPYMRYTTWQEYLVSLAAHEARHIYQYQHMTPRSEVDAERFAAKALDRYRAQEKAA